MKEWERFDKWLKAGFDMLRDCNAGRPGYCMLYWRYPWRYPWGRTPVDYIPVENALAERDMRTARGYRQLGQQRKLRQGVDIGVDILTWQTTRATKPG